MDRYSQPRSGTPTTGGSGTGDVSTRAATTARKAKVRMKAAKAPVAPAARAGKASPPPHAKAHGLRGTAPGQVRKAAAVAQPAPKNRAAMPTQAAPRATEATQESLTARNRLPSNLPSKPRTQPRMRE